MLNMQKTFGYLKMLDDTSGMGEVDSIGTVDKLMDMVDNMVTVDKMDMEDNIDMVNFKLTLRYLKLFIDT